VKGLEFDIVFLASCNEGLFPLSYAMQNKGDDISYELAEAEERSLMYVALTRAKKAVYVTSYGRESVFLLNI
jgi:superfamily I DNA/RNA helicase